MMNALEDQTVQQEDVTQRVLTDVQGNPQKSIRMRSKQFRHSTITPYPEHLKLYPYKIHQLPAAKMHVQNRFVFNGMRYVTPVLVKFYTDEVSNVLTDLCVLFWLLL